MTVKKEFIIIFQFSKVRYIFVVKINVLQRTTFYLHSLLNSEFRLSDIFRSSTRSRNLNMGQELMYFIVAPSVNVKIIIIYKNLLRLALF